MHDYSDEITDYIYKRMSKLQREAFELRLENDPKLAAEVRLQQKMLEGVRDARSYEEAMNDPHLEEAERMAQEILNESSEETGNTSKTTARTRIILIARILTSAAAILLLFIIPFGRNHMYIKKLRSIQKGAIRKSWKLLWLR